MPNRDPSLPSRRSIRLSGYDYRQSGAYFVTICAFKKSCLFGQTREGKMYVNDLGMTGSDCWQQISHVRRNVELDDFVVMPNHLHGIIILFDDEPVRVAAQTYGQIEVWEHKLPSGSLGVILGQFKRAVTMRSKLLAQPPDQHIWQRNYYDHIIRNETSLNSIRKYIVENPARWLDDSLHAE